MDFDFDGDMFGSKWVRGFQNSINSYRVVVGLLVSRLMFYLNIIRELLQMVSKHFGQLL